MKLKIKIPLKDKKMKYKGFTKILNLPFIPIPGDDLLLKLKNNEQIGLDITRRAYHQHLDQIVITCDIWGHEKTAQKKLLADGTWSVY